MRPLRLLPLLVALACASPPSPGARPEINADFRKPDVDVDRWVGTLESESREIAAQRKAITEALGLRPGQAVADIGAGTGLFEEPFARAVGPTGVVYAVDIAPAFIEHIRERAAAAGLSQVQPVLCDDRSTGLPPGSVDVAFVCDTYHHFENPSDTLASLREALRPGGRLVVVDFERVEGQSRAWVLEHVRCGREQVIAEIEAAGFRYTRTLPVAGLSENYVIEFARGDAAAAVPAPAPAEAAAPVAAPKVVAAPIDLKTMSMTAVVEAATHGDAATRLAVIDQAIALLLDDREGGPLEAAGRELPPGVEEQTRLAMWGTMFPITMAAARPALEARTWDAGDVSVAEAFVDFLALLPDPPDFAFRDGDDAGNHEEADRLREWLGKRLADPHFRASIIFTFDDGPFFPDVLTDVEELPHRESVQVPNGLSIHVGDAVRDGADGRPRSFLQGMGEQGVAWTVFLDHAEPGCSVISIQPDEPFGWHLTLSFGERVSVSLGGDGKPEFYFVSW